MTPPPPPPPSASNPAPDEQFILDAIDKMADKITQDMEDLQENTALPYTELIPRLGNELTARLDPDALL